MLSVTKLMVWNADRLSAGLGVITSLCLGRGLGVGLCLMAVAMFSPARSEALALGEEADLLIEVVVVSDYVFRGISQTGEDPAVQLSLELELQEIPVSFGIWGSQVDFDDVGTGTLSPIDYELDFWVRVSVPVFEDLDLDFSIIQYYYPSSTGDEDYTEWLIGTEVGNVYIEGVYSEDYGGQGEFYRLSAEYVHSFDAIDVGVHYGWNHYARPQSLLNNDNIYMDWGVSASIEWSGIKLGVEYTDVSRCSATGGDACDARMLGSISYSF